MKDYMFHYLAPPNLQPLVSFLCTDMVQTDWNVSIYFLFLMSKCHFAASISQEVERVKEILLHMASNKRKIFVLQDLCRDCTLNYLRRIGFKRFVLWGRSMGATSSLLYCIKYRPDDVILQIVDSAFFSFEMIAFDIANKNVKAPQFVVSFGLQMAKKNCQKFEYNPFSIQLQQVKECKVPAIFVYCEQDNVISSRNTQLICSHFKTTYEKLIIEENHNTIRSAKTLSKIFHFVEKYLKFGKRKSPTKSLTNLFSDKTPKNIESTKSLLQQNSIMSSQPSKINVSRKGIQRVQKHSGIKNVDKQISKQYCHNFDDYGIWVASKFMQKNTQNKDKEKEKDKGNLFNQKQTRKESSKKMQLSLRTSMIHKKEKKGQGIQTIGLKSQEKANINKSQWDFLTPNEPKRSKLSTVRSLGGSRQLNNSKYL